MAINYTKTNWVDGQAPAISASNLNKIENGLKSACDGVDTLLPPSGSFIEQKTLLWENASPTSEFPSQTVSLDLSGYDAVEIKFKQWVNNTEYTTTKVFVGEKTPLQTFGDQYARENLRRYATASNSGIVFAICTVFNIPNTSSTESASGCIPIKIYGIKEV